MPAYSLEFWRNTLPLCDLWRTLTPAQRSTCLAIAPTYKAAGAIPLGLSPAAYDAFLEKDETGRLRARKEFARFQKMILRALDWCLDDGIDLSRYLQQMTTTVQRYALTGGHARSAAESAIDMENRLNQGRFGADVMASPTAESFLAGVGGWQEAGLPYDEAAHVQVKAWVKAQAAETAPARVLTTETLRLPGQTLPPEALLALVLEYGIGILAVSPRTLQPLLNVPRPGKKASQGPERIVLEPFEGTQAFARPFLLDDMAAYLRAARAAPVPLLSDGVSVPVAHHRKVAKTLLPLPFEVPMPGWEDERRAEAAWWMLVELKLMVEGKPTRKGWTAEPARKAEAWLAKTREERLQDVLERYRFGDHPSQIVHRRFSYLGDFPAHPFPYSALDIDVIKGLDRAVEQLTRPVDFGTWFHSVTESANPFIAALERNAELAYRWRRWDATPREVFGRLLSFHVARLCSMGALELRSDQEGCLGIALTSLGRWLHGQSESWTLPPAERAIAVVGGDFTVTLLEPSLELEAELTAFAEPVSGMGGAGAAYRLTRKSVQQAAHAGLAAEKMIEVLKAWTRHALPANVVHELKAWSATRRTFKVREALLVEGEDPMAVAEMMAALPKEFERVSPTMLAYVGKSKPQALVQRLAKKGFLF